MLSHNYYYIYKLTVTVLCKYYLNIIYRYNINLILLSSEYIEFSNLHS